MELKGGKFPGMPDKPKLKYGDRHYLDAFYHLHYSRDYGSMGGARAIKMAEILAYLDLIGESGRDERPRFMRVIQLLDSVYLKYAAEKAKANEKAS